MPALLPDNVHLKDLPHYIITLWLSEEAKGCPKPRLGNLWIYFLGQGFKDYYSAIKVLTTRPRTPVFDPSVPTKVTTDSDTTAILSCKVHHLGNHTVSTFLKVYLYLWNDLRRDVHWKNYFSLIPKAYKLRY